MMQKKLIVFLHGFPETGLLNWKHQVIHFAKLGYKVIAPDQRGYNTSTKGNMIDINHAKAAKDIAALIQHYKYSKAYIVAHDWGGQVAWTFAVKYEQMVEKMIVCNVPHPAVFEEYIMTKQLFKSWYMFFFQLDGIAEWKIFRDDFSWLISFAFERSNQGSYSLNELERYKEAWREEGAINSMLHWYRYVIRAKFLGIGELGDIKQQVKVPTLLLWGTLDVHLEAAMANDSVAKNIVKIAN